MSADDFDALARWLADFPPPDDPFDALAGLQPTGPMTITARFVPPDHEVCDICTDVFFVGPEGTPVLTYAVEDGAISLVACPDCVMAALSAPD